MLAIRVDAHGGPEVLGAVEMAEPTPRPGQVLARHEVIGVNYVDTQHRAGAPYPVELPLIPGIEAAGHVVAVGPGAGHLRDGDRVAYAGPMVGVYAEFAAETVRTIASAVALLVGGDGRSLNGQIIRIDAGTD